MSRICNYEPCKKELRPGHQFCSARCGNFDKNAKRLCFFCEQDNRINDNGLMFKSCGKPKCLIRNTHYMFGKMQQWEADALTTQRRLREERDRAEDYKRMYREEKTKSRKRSRSTSRRRQRSPDVKRTRPVPQFIQPAQFIARPYMPPMSQPINYQALDELTRTLQSLKDRSWNET
jgi:hypothetical protein